MLLSKQLFREKVCWMCKSKEPTYQNTHKVKEEPCESGEKDDYYW